MRQAREPYPSYLTGAAKQEKDNIPVVPQVLVQIHRRIKKNIPVRGIQTTPRTNHISSRNKKSNPCVDHQPLRHTKYPNPRVNRLQYVCRIQTDSFVQSPKTPDGSKHNIAEIVSREYGELKVGLAPYEISGIDRKRNVKAVRPVCECSSDFAYRILRFGRS